MAFLEVNDRKHRGDIYKHVLDNCTTDEYAVKQIPKVGRYSKPCDLVLTYRGFIRAAQTYKNDQGRKMQNFTIACTDAIVGMVALAQIQKREDQQTIALLKSKKDAEEKKVIQLQCTRNNLAREKAKLQFETASALRDVVKVKTEKLLLANGVYNIIRNKLELNPEYKDNRPANADAQTMRIIMKSFWQRGLLEKANHRTLFKNLDCLRTGMALIMSHRMKRWKEHFWKG